MFGPLRRTTCGRLLAGRSHAAARGGLQPVGRPRSSELCRAPCGQGRGSVGPEQGARCAADGFSGRVLTAASQECARPVDVVGSLPSHSNCRDDDDEVRDLLTGI